MENTDLKEDDITAAPSASKDGEAAGLSVSASKTKLSALVKKIKGIKNIELIVSLVVIAVALLIYAGIKSAPAKDTAEPDSVNTAASEMTVEETRLAAVLSRIEGVGKVTVMISKSDDGKPISAVVVAEGAKNPGIKLKLLEAVETALSLPGSAVEIYASA
ncbi:MAG: hypothetical protein LBT55_03610 [Clostridiaceae bacterium]|jgi:hypothetical protein|nr:hypothetical protein [Clostridiaceae bacterium]